jgi:transcriptional regulator of arginine metabolism
MQGRSSTTPTPSASTPAVGSETTLAAAVAAPFRSDVRSKPDRQRAIRELVADETVGSQQELVDRLNERGFAVTQATVSRDIAELGLVKVPRAAGHVYVTPETLGRGSGPGGPSTSADSPAPRSDDRLRRILADIPVRIGRSGLTLLVTGTPGTASVIAQAIDDSSLTEQEGTLAGDNTLLVLFADEARLLAWRDRFDRIRSTALEAPTR